MQIPFTDIETVLLKKIGATADTLNVEAFVVGGFVRDKILRRQTKDIDIMCVGSGIQLAEKLKTDFFPDAFLTVYKNFGTALLKNDDFEIEFVGARKESYRTESRKPIVEDGTLQDDLSRRDFTINALAVRINTNNFGELVDEFNGLEDLKNEIIRTPLEPNITFSDDPLRMMRGIRFATQLQFKIHPETVAAIKENHERIKIISQERITDELNKIILSATPSIGFNLLDKVGLLNIIFPDFVLLKGAEYIDGKGHKDNFHHTLQVLDNICMSTKDLWLRWAAILHDIAKPQTKRFEKNHGWTFHGHEVLGSKMVPRIFNKLKLPTHEKMRFVQKMVFLHLRPISLTKENITDSAIRRLLFEAGEDVDELMKLCEADITSKNRQKVIRYLENFELVRKRMKVVEESDHLRNWQPPISGELIMQTFKIEPCKVVGIIKDEIREQILDGKIENNYEAAFKLMLQLGAEQGLKV
jgi:putative nucleotidyltransferase with HDIG domain